MLAMRNVYTVLKLLCVICFLQIAFTIFLILKVYNSAIDRPDRDEVESSSDIINLARAAELKVIELSLYQDNDYTHENSINSLYRRKDVLTDGPHVLTVEIWGKAAIASYLWGHILKGSKSYDKSHPGFLTGNLLVKNYNFSYKEGPGLNLNSSNPAPKFLVFVGNGRTEEKCIHLKNWMEFLRNTKLLVILLGNEKCENKWIKEYIFPNGPIRAVLLVYDDPIIDDNIFVQWPLGVATYRQFPTLTYDQTSPDARRKYLCNLQATNYGNSSRSQLFRHLHRNHLASRHCYLLERTVWKVSETVKSMNEYVFALIQSDLTFCPSGYNAETYRLYEAIEAGSVPVVVEDDLKRGCDPAPLRLMKQFNAPVIWLRNWKEFPSLLKVEHRLTLKQKVQRRQKLMQWYDWFKLRMGDRFLSLVEEKLLNPN